MEKTNKENICLNCGCDLMRHNKFMGKNKPFGCVIVIAKNLKGLKNE